ncbi:DUF6479 family protein [Streptomyces sp. JJ36]|uniref:DUF6479 family protein n=1 Tax=Streptomyces sp. JJ36 TaxID=2736645 RepID=UPI001F19CCD0|nr:DUF6479 family protein [Streptomyces sp. JJ36]MCF6522678.1 hypothetical protein [Streptomyces sp. JJ36]
MDTAAATTVLLAVTRDHLIGLAPLVIGLGAVAVLIGAVAYGMRLRSRGEYRRSGAPPGRPRGARTHEEHITSPDEMPHDGRRRYPYEVRDWGVTESDDARERPKWQEGGGGFGSGGPGHTG